MLSITLPTITETVTLNGIAVQVRPLPLFFNDFLSRALVAPADREGMAYRMHSTRWFAARVVEALGESAHISYVSVDGACTGRPAWDNSMDWPAYAAACVDALETAGFTNTHMNAITEAIERLEARQLEVVSEVGNS